MKGVWRPECRNRNIGTKAFRCSKSNDMRIPESWVDRDGNFSAYYERLESPRVETVEIGQKRVDVLYEEPRAGFSYGCCPTDIRKILLLIESQIPALPDIVAFRQPTRKQRQQSPVWGRFIYSAQLEKHEGTAILLEAQELHAPLRWSKRMTLDSRAEYERLVDDGHIFMETKRYYIANLREDSVRNTLLYRTFLHELGHLADYHQKVLDLATALAPDREAADDLYFSRPPKEREAFAHRFADELKLVLLRNGAIPFAPGP